MCPDIHTQTDTRHAHHVRIASRSGISVGQPSIHAYLRKGRTIGGKTGLEQLELEDSEDFEGPEGLETYSTYSILASKSICNYSWTKALLNRLTTASHPCRAWLGLDGSGRVSGRNKADICSQMLPPDTLCSSPPDICIQTLPVHPASCSRSHQGQLFVAAFSVYHGAKSDGRSSFDVEFGYLGKSRRRRRGRRRREWKGQTERYHLPPSSSPSAPPPRSAKKTKEQREDKEQENRVSKPVALTKASLNMQSSFCS